jgi:hypothetical protein
MASRASRSSHLLDPADKVSYMTGIPSYRLHAPRLGLKCDVCVLMVLLIIAHPGSIEEPRLPNLEVVVVGSRKLDGGWRGGSKRDSGGRSVGERRNVTINHFGGRGYRT